MRNPVSGLATSAARWSARHPWRAVGTWLVLVAVALGLAIAVPTETADGSDYWIGESGRASELVRDGGLDHPDTETVLVAGDLDRDRLQAAADQIIAGMQAAPGVADVSGPQWNPDHTALLIDVQLARDDIDVEPLTVVTAQAAAAHPELEISQAGDSTTDAAINELVADDLRSAEVTSVPITLALMLVAFGALIAAGLPVLLAIGSVVATIGLTAPLSHLIHAEETVTSMIVLIGMAVGVDYSLFFLKRAREERAAGRSTRDAVEIAAATSGHSILVSGGAVIASMTGLFVVGMATFNSLAAGSILVVAIAVFGSITVLPALMVLLGGAVDRPRVPLLWRLNRRIGQGGISSRILAPVLRRPVAALVFSAVVLGALAAPAVGMKLAPSGLETLPQSIPEVKTFERISEEFPGQFVSVDVVATGADARELTAALTGLESEVTARPGYAALPDSIRVAADGRTAVLTLGITSPDGSERTADAVRLLRDDLAPRHLDGVVGEYAVGGGAAEALDTVDRLGGRMGWVIGSIILLTLLMMGFAFRSAVIAALSAALNLVSVAVAFGVMTLVFQHGWGSGLLDFSTPGHLIDWLPLFVLVVLVGLSMDYHVFVLGRVREYVAAGVPSRLAVRKGITDTAGGRRGDQRRSGDGLGLLHLRAAVDDGDEDDGRRPGGRDPDRRDSDSVGAAAGGHDVAGRPGLVAGAAAPAAGGGRRGRLGGSAPRC